MPNVPAVDPGAGFTPSDGSRTLSARGSLARAWGVVLLLLVELLGLTVRFDGQGLVPTRLTGDAHLAYIHSASPADRLTTWSIEHASAVLGTLAAGVLSTACFGGKRLREELARLAGPSLWRWSWLSLVGHAASFATFTWVSVQVFERNALSSPQSLVWCAAWWSAGLISIAFLAAVLVAPRYWWPLVQRALPAWAAGICFGVLALQAGGVTRQLWLPLGKFTLHTVRAILCLVCQQQVVCQPAEFLVGTSRFSVIIAPQCSGYEGLGLVLAFCTAYLWFFRRQLRFPHAWLLIPLGITAILLVNAIRIAALVLVGTYLSEEIAGGGFHSVAGSIGFCTVGIGLALMAQRLSFFRYGRESDSTGTRLTNPAACYLAPLLSILAVGMVTGAFSPVGFDLYYPLRVLAAAVPLWLYRRRYAGLRWEGSWHAVAIGTIAFGAWMAMTALAPGGSPSRSAPVGYKPNWLSLWAAARFIGAVVTVPLAEELAFRGFLARRLISIEFESVRASRLTWPSLLVSSAAFGALHGRWLGGMVAGVLYALCYRRRGSIGDAVVAHATTNVLIAVVVLRTGDWSLWS